MSYPGVDLVTDHAAIVVQRRPVVSFTSWIADAMRRCAEEGRVMQIVTPSDARLTRPLRMALRPPSSHWVVRDDGGGYYEGISGVRLRWDDTAFVPDVDDHGSGTVAEAFTRAADDLGVLLTLNVVVRHPAPERTTLGLAVERLVSALTGSSPSGWGPAEPATQPWNRADLTTACRDRGSRPTHLVFVAASVADAAPTALGTIRATPGDAGVEEMAEIVIGYRDARTVPREDLGALIGMATAKVPFDSLLAFREVGPPDLTVLPHWVGLPTPIGVALGPGLVRTVGRNRVFNAEGFRPLAVGGVEPSVWYSVDGDDSDSTDRHERLHRLLQHLGGDKYFRYFGTR
jgi:Family of unknown function (DUF6177)